MKRLIACIGITVFLLVAVTQTRLRAQPRVSLYQNRDAWYEFLLKQFNKDDVDYGAWLERRRQALLATTVKNPYFGYSLFVTIALFLALTAYGKTVIDHRRKMLVTAEMMTDLLNQDQYSREAAKTAIAELNEHMERCNRAIEAGIPGDEQLGSDATNLRAELERLANELSNAIRDRDKATEELAQKSSIVADMSLRIDALAKKLDGKSVELPTVGGQATNPDLVAHINRLEQELYGERQRNKRLKGA
jgi:hypothetical protein